MVPCSLFIKLNAIFAIVLLRFEYGLGTCIERDEQLQKYLTSSKPPFDNYFNISKAVYPSVDLPSMLIDITVKFLKSAGEKSNGSDSLSTSEQNVSRSTTFKIENFTWSMSCLYVSGGISLSSMNWFSLGAIYPNRRGSKLHITLPQFCNVSTVDRQKTMIYFLSTLQDIAVIPLVSDPRLNTVECVIPGHGKAPQFSGVKQLLHGVCWSFLAISLAMSTFSSQWIILKLKSWDGKKNCQSKIAAVMLLSLLLSVGGLGISLTNICLEHDNIYICVFFGSIWFVLLRRMVWCLYLRRWKWFSIGNLTEGHGKMPTENPFSGVVLYPAVFIAYHHLLWILLGIITEPHWGFTVLVAVVALYIMFFFSFSELYCVSSENSSSEKGQKSFICVMSFCLIIAILSAFVLFTLVLLVVAQVFLSKSLILALIQNILTCVVTVWFGYVNIFKESNPGDKGEGGSKCNGNGAEGAGGEDIPGKTAKTLKELKDAITESKAKSKEVSKRDLEDELRKAASDKGLKISDNDGEGNCLFHALSEQLKIVGDKDISYDKLREALVQYLTDNSELDDGTDLFNFFEQSSHFGTWNEYLTYMAKDGSWGDAIVIAAAANRYKIPIKVITVQRGEEARENTIEPVCEVQSGNPIWLGHIYDCHFVSLLKAGNLKEGPIDRKALPDIRGAMMGMFERLGRAFGINDNRSDKIAMEYPKNGFEHSNQLKSMEEGQR